MTSHLPEPEQQVLVTPSRDSRPLARLLVDAVQQVGGQPYPWREFDTHAVVRAALVHGVAPALALHLRGRNDVPAELQAVVQRCYRDQLARHLRTMADLRRLTELLGQSSIRWAVIKGPALSEVLWPRFDMRLYVDLDVLVHPADFREAVDLLLASGTRLVDRNWPLISRGRRGELGMELAGGTPLDLHWHVVNDPQLRDVFRFPIADMLDRGPSVLLRGSRTRTLDAADTLLHLVYHMVHSGGHKLVWLKDVDLAMTQDRLDWRELEHRAQEYGCALALEAVINRVQMVLPSARSGLKTRPRRSLWSTGARVVDRWRRPPHLPDERWSGRIVFQSTRAGTWQSVRAAADAALHRPPTGHHGASNPLHDDRPDQEAQATFFEMIENDRPPRSSRLSPPPAERPKP
ncbi:nucleotidyltransferase family protein [Intrasporangium chromatireducens]|uniref:nucleotidyltransferase domain-containing protein n=1 Tax=Intrasporangium chromatireducens TaxID=1386088 RepID=UPI00138E12F1|nr:nucleotidyltransferase family protein [Intrasporangium chromatireducens]